MRRFQRLSPPRLSVLRHVRFDPLRSASTPVDVGEPRTTKTKTGKAKTKTKALQALAALAMMSLIIRGAPAAEAASIGPLRPKFQNQLDEAESGPSKKAAAAAAAAAAAPPEASASAGRNRSPAAPPRPRPDGPESAEASAAAHRQLVECGGNAVWVQGTTCVNRILDREDWQNYYLDMDGLSKFKYLDVKDLLVEGTIYGLNSDYYLRPSGTSNITDLQLNKIVNELSVESGVVRVVTDDDSPRTNKMTGIFWSNNDNKKIYGVYREEGAWTSPYPDLRIAFTTGIKIGAKSKYGGVRFYNSAHMDDTDTGETGGKEVLSVGTGGNNVKVKYDLTVDGTVYVSSLADSDGGNAYACLDRAGKIFRSSVPCPEAQ